MASGTVSPSESIRSSQIDAPKALKFSDEDVISFFVLHAGPIFDARPDLAKKFGYVRTHPSATVVTAIDDLMQKVDPAFHERVTVALQSGDPVRAQAGLGALTSDYNKAVIRVKSSNTKTDTLSPDGWKNGPVVNFVDTINFVAAAAIVLGAVAVLAGAVLVIFYAPDTSASEYDQQLNALAISTSLN